MSRAIRKQDYDACEEDCFNCIYADCIKPDYLLRSENTSRRGKYDRNKGGRWVKKVYSPTKGVGK